jgi:hypothetical protein
MKILGVLEHIAGLTILFIYDCGIKLKLNFLSVNSVGIELLG